MEKSMVFPEGTLVKISGAPFRLSEETELLGNPGNEVFLRATDRSECRPDCSPPSLTPLKP
jgi:hypothetical protein